MSQPYLHTHQQRFLEELMEWLKIPSISADKQYQPSIQEAAKFIAEKLREAGCDEVAVMPTAGNPVVFGSCVVDVNKPTILVYGHYDVQPPDPLDLWDSPPFEPVIKDEKIYARGAADDKGQVYMHVKALEILKQGDGFPCNVKFLIEGEEEVGSENLEIFVAQQKQILACDAIVISDSSLLSLENPSMTVGLRGLAYVEVCVTGPSRDLHSGVYGGAVANPINVLSKIINELHDDEGKVTIPGFYDKVHEFSKEERKALNEAPFSLEAYKKDLNIEEIHGETGYTTLERVGIRPTLDVNGMWGGYIGEGAKTVLPSKAYAKISMRLVPYQNAERIADLICQHLKNIAPPYVTLTVEKLHGGNPAITPTDSTAYLAAEAAYTEVFGKKPIPMRDGGSIPIVALFKELLNVDTVLMGFGYDSDAIHSPNEHFGIANFVKGIETIVAFHHQFGKKFTKES